MRALLLAAIASAGMIGCVGGLEDMGTHNPPPATGSDAARQLFNDNVYGIIAGQCGSCHTNGREQGNVTGFVDATTPAADANKAWTTVNGYTSAVGVYTPTSSDLLQNPLKGHKGTSYSTDQQQKISDWLAAELAWRGTGAGSGSGSGTATRTADQLLSQWSGCMTQTNFDTAQMATAWGNMQSNAGQCKQCHVVGQSNMEASDVSTQMFTILSASKYCMAQYFSVDLANQKIIVNNTSITNVSKALPPHSAHPNFQNNLAAGMTALQAFYTTTMQNLTAGTCGAPKF